MSQIFLFTGENAFALQSEKKRWISEFNAKYGQENLIRLTGKSLKYADLLDEVASMPFIAEKRLIVIDGIPKTEKDQMKALEDHIHPQTLLLFIEPKPDKRLSSTKELLSTATVKTFDPLSSSALIRFIMDYAQSHGSSIDQSTSSYLISLVGNNQMLLASEIEKLSQCASPDAITTQHIDDLVVLSEAQAVWKLMDLMCAGKKREALEFISTLYEKGETPHSIWNRFLWIIAQITPVTSCVQEGETNIGAITKKTNVPFPTVKTLIALSRRIDSTSLRSLISLISTTDTNLKTGKIKATGEAPEELRSALDVCIAKACSL